MLVTTGRKLARDEGGAIAPLYALALFGLIGMAGVGFDYARVMALDTELQNAADQAALAAATQLDGRSDSIIRAKQAVDDYFAKAGGSYVNITRLSTIDDDNDGNTRPIAKVSYAFWEDYTNDAPDKPVAESAADSSKAEVVQVTIANRSLQYALTPVVGAIVGTAGASAMATIESAFCKVPPLMMCVPNSGFGANDATGKSPDRGTGVMLHMLPNNKVAGSTDTTDAEDEVLAPGLFGFLDFPYPKPAGAKTNESLGWEVTGSSCTGETVDSEPGVRSPEAGALSTRFDIDSNCLTNGSYCPAQNTTKNRVYRYTTNKTLSNCTTDMIGQNVVAGDAKGKSDGWVRKEDDANLTSVPSRGYSRDSSHTNNIGNKNWDLAAYFATNYGSTVGTVTGNALGTDATRYDVYKWELQNPTKLVPRMVKSVTDGKSNTYYCAFPTPIGKNVGTTLPSSGKDRRVLSIAAVDCTGLHGRSPVDILRYIDVFLVEPPLTGTDDKEFYIEVIGESTLPGGNTFQALAKRKAVLLR